MQEPTRTSEAELAEPTRQQPDLLSPDQRPTSDPAAGSTATGVKPADTAVEPATGVEPTATAAEPATGVEPTATAAEPATGVEPTATVAEPAAEPPAPNAESSAATTPDHAAEEAGLAEAATELDAVEAALARLEAGSLDRCEVCGAPIGRDRLLQDPLLTRCRDHATAG